MPETRDRAWGFMREHFDEIFARVASTRAGYAPWYSDRVLLRGAGGARWRRSSRPRIESLPGGPRNLRGALEAIRLCAARVDAQRESAEAFFARHH